MLLHRFSYCNRTQVDRQDFWGLKDRKKDIDLENQS